MTPKLKKKKQGKSKKKRDKGEVTLELDDAIGTPADAKEDFDLDLDAAQYQGKKGQSGNRVKSSS